MPPQISLKSIQHLCAVKNVDVGTRHQNNRHWWNWKHNSLAPPRIAWPRHKKSSVMGRGTWVTWVTGQLCNGHHGSFMDHRKWPIISSWIYLFPVTPNRLGGFVRWGKTACLHPHPKSASELHDSQPFTRRRTVPACYQEAVSLSRSTTFRRRGELCCCLVATTKSPSHPSSAASDLLIADQGLREPWTLNAFNVLRCRLLE